MQLTMDKDSLINAYIQEVIDGMDLKDCDYMTESYANYSYDEVKEEVEEYYPSSARRLSTYAYKLPPKRIKNVFKCLYKYDLLFYDG